MERMLLADEWAPTMARCLGDEGFPYLEVGADGGVSWTDVPGEQIEGFDIARYVCTARYPRDPRDQEPLDGAQLDFLYDYYAGELTDCLRERGFEVPEAPSRQQFRDSYSGHPWLPHSDAYKSAESEEDLAELEAACPQLPDGLY